MHYANHYYGHAHVMAEYAGIPFPVMIWGFLQHGWNIHDGFADGTVFLPGAPLFVWSDAPMRRGWAMGRRDYHVIGSAWAYLLELEREGRTEFPQQPAEKREGTIFYPFHGWEGQEVVGDHAAMLRRIREVEEGPITVCLYWAEHRNKAIRRVYEEGGCRVITHGYRGYAYRQTDVKFLHKQLAELRSHERVISNRLSSAILYGASAGCEVGVYGDPMVVANERPVYGGIERLLRRWPELHQEHVSREIADQFAVEELGIAHVRQPQEIMELFRWTRPTAVVPGQDVTPRETLARRAE